MKRKYIIILISLLVIGFASVTTTLVLNGNTLIGVKEEDFDVIFVEALLDGKEDEKATISEDKKTITFSTDKLSSIGDQARLDYKVKNTSTQYDADVTINCTNEANEYVEVKGEFDENSLPLENNINIKAQEIKNGYINAKLIKAYVGEDASIEISCKITFTATSRENYAYSLTFDSNGGNKIEDKRVELNESYGELDIPEKEGYTFVGWYDENDNKVDETTKFDTKGNRNLYAKWKYICPYDPGKVWEFDYTGNEQTFTVPCDGEYKVELWGASGFFNESIIPNSYGLGAYVQGKIHIQRNNNYYINIGGQPLTSEAPAGEATDFRFVSKKSEEFDSLKSRIMVAGGGGGGMYVLHMKLIAPGHAGGLIGYDAIGDHYGDLSYSGKGGTQTSGGQAGISGVLPFDPMMNGSFGKGGSSAAQASAGGGGYYGGGHGRHSGGSWPGGGGGSSFISGHNGCDAIAENSTQSNIIHTGQSNHYSGYIFTDTVMIDGLGYKWTNVKGSYTGMPTHDGKSTMTGNTGNGYAKITYLGR